MAKQKRRSEIDIDNTWDLTYIFTDRDNFYEYLDKVKKEIINIKKFQGHIFDNSETLYSFLATFDEVERKLYRLYYYAHLTLDVDTSSTISQEMEGKVTNLFYDYSCMTTFVNPEMMKQDYQTVLNYINENKKLEKYRFNLEDFYRYQPHSLNDDEERMMTLLSKALSVSSSTFESLTDADMEFGNIKVDGEEIELTESNYNTFIKDSNRDIRKQAFEKFLGTYATYKNTLASTFNGNVEILVSMAKIHKFNSSLEASLFGDKIDVSVYNRLIDTVKDHLDILYKYYALKKEVLDVDQLHMYDIYMDLVKDDKREYSFKEAKEIVKEALSVLGEDYIHNLNKAFEERWIDIYNNKGKRTGAYSSGFYDTKPYVLLNFEGKYNDVTTLAHELGHSMHTYYSCSNNSYNNSSYNIFVAEVASTVNELLLVKYLLKKAVSKDEKLFLLNQLLELYKGTIYRQVMFAEFERNMHKSLENGEILTYDYLSQNYYQLVKEYFGKDVICDDLIQYEWERIPHFYYNFYVYKYAIGLSCATKIVNDILSGKKDAIEHYLAFLKSGGSDYPAKELLLADVDINDNNLYLEAMKSFDNYIDEFKSYCK